MLLVADLFIKVRHFVIECTYNCSATYNSHVPAAPRSKDKMNTCRSFTDKDMDYVFGTILSYEISFILYQHGLFLNDIWLHSTRYSLPIILDRLLSVYWHQLLWRRPLETSWQFAIGLGLCSGRVQKDCKNSWLSILSQVRCRTCGHLAIIDFRSL